MHKITKLDNGLTIITERMPNMHSLSVGFWVKAGGRYEPKEKQGISHFLEHLLFKGTKKRNYKQLKEAVEGVGGIFNAFTAEENTCYYIKIISKYFKVAVDVLADMVLNPLLDEKEINKERNVIVEEIRMYLDLPNQYVHELLDELLWPNHPLGRSLLGTFDTVGSIKRHDLAAYKEKYHAPSNVIVAVCGDIEHEMIVNMLQEYFAKTKKAQATDYKKAAKVQHAPKINCFNKDTEQSHICLGVHGLNRLHPGRYAQRILNVILGGNMSSRLFNEVREKRCLAYEIGSGIKQYIDTGSIYIHAGVDNHKVSDAVSVIIAELIKMKEANVREQELVRAKEYYKGHLLMGLEDTMSNMLFLGEQAASIGKITTKDEIIEDMKKVDFDAIKKVANKLFVNDSLNLAVIGPQAQAERDKLQKKFKF
ncbi:MAG: pitrilysin family protein [Candidatus Omnitrophota bacterium]